MPNPLDNFQPETDVGILCTQPVPSEPPLLRIIRYKDNVPLNFTEVRLPDFIKYGWDVAYLIRDKIAEEFHQRDQFRRWLMGSPEEPFDEWYLRQPAIVQLTDGQNTWHFRMTFDSWQTCEAEFKRIRSGEFPIQPIERTQENTSEQPHIIKEVQ